MLRLENVSYTYKKGNGAVLNNVNIEFEASTVYGIVGKSGSGKSTLLSLMAGLDTVTDGLVEYNEKDLKTLDRDVYRAQNIGVIFQSFNLLTTLSALENIVLSMNISESDVKDKEAFALNLLDRLGISEELAKRKVLNLSGGEQQRVAIARALSHNPDVMIADEPTANLDEDTAASIMEILQSLAKDEGKCVIIVSHSRQVASYVDALYGINGGNISFIK